MQELLNHNAKVYLAARSAAKANAAIAELKDVTGKEAIFLQLDLADITAVRRSAEEFLSYVLSTLCICA
jgi:retinol dehydrogenase 12